MAHLWIKDEAGDWAIAPLNGEVFTLQAAGPRVRRGALDEPGTVLLRRADSNGDWVLMGREPDSHRWYRFFFHNHFYFALKHMPRRALPRLLWRLYRGHVLNRPYAREGVRFLLARHRAWAAGLAGARATYRDARREAPR